MSPIRCSHCGTNFMRHTKNPEERLCNNCEIKEKNRNPKPKDDNMSTVNVTMCIESSLHQEIEEYCNNAGMSYGQLFTKLFTEKDKIAHCPDLYQDVQQLNKEDEPLKEIKRGRPKK